MSDLQLALIAAGAAAVAGVWGYNKWQECQHRQLAEKIFKGGQPDVLLGGESAGTEPSLGDTPFHTLEAEDPAIGGFAAPATATAVSAAAGETADTAHDASAASLPPLPGEYADDIADCLVRMDFTEAVPAPALWAMQARWAGHVGKQLSWLGFDGGVGAWRRLSALSEPSSPRPAASRTASRRRSITRACSA